MKFKNIIFSLLVLLNNFDLSAQDSLHFDILKPLTYSFEIIDGQMYGSGADFIYNETVKAQFTMLGEYHGSKNISTFTSALIPLLSKSGYKTLALEVGPITGKFLNQLSPIKTEVMKALYENNQRYQMTNSDGEIETAIPFFEGREDADFLGVAKENEWNIIGIDQEYCFANIMLCDWMFANLNNTNKMANQDIYQSTIDTLSLFYQDWFETDKSIFISIKNSPQIQAFLEAMSQEKSNLPIIEAWKMSIDIYYLNAERKWYENNATRINYMKSSLNNGLNESNFDISQDKLLVKMGAYHVSKGFSPLALYEIGNTLNELAEFNGNTALGIGFINRYELENGIINDALLSGNPYYTNIKNFLLQGDSVKWSIIDLRDIRKGFYYYPQKFILNAAEEKLIQRFDFLVVVPTDTYSTPNY